jgi:protein phosphatase
VGKAQAGKERRGVVRMASATHIGASPRRTLLEDRARAELITTAGGLQLSLGVVADGIGGENAGERAAELTVQTVIDHSRASSETNVPRLLEQALQEANQRVYAEAHKSRRKTNMGSTAAVAAIVDGRLYLANAGDSRVYLLRGRKVLPLTLDHTWAEEVARSGKLSRLEASRHPRRNEIVRSVGYEPSLKVDLGLWLRGGEETESEARSAQGLPLERGDVVLVCSDGLIKGRHDRPGAAYVEASEFVPLVRGKSPKRAAEDLVKRALARQVDDNVTAVVLEMPGGGSLPRRLAPAAGIGALGLAAVAAGAVLLPRLVGGFTSAQPAPTIPPLPSGVAFVSEVAGGAEVQQPGGEFQPLQAGALVAAGSGVRLRTSGPGSYIRLGLADRSILYVGPHTQLELTSIGGAPGEQTVVALDYGLALIAADTDSAAGALIRSPGGVMARVAGSQLGASWEPIRGEFGVDCFGPSCEVVFPAGITMSLTAGQHVTISLTGDVIGPTMIQVERYAFGGYAGGLAALPGSTAGGGSGSLLSAPTRTPLGPLYVSPTPPPPPPPTNTPRPPEPEPAPTKPPPTAEPTEKPTKEPTEEPTEEPTDEPTEEPPEPTETPVED